MAAGRRKRVCGTAGCRGRQRGLQARVCGRAGGRGPGCMLQPGRGEVVRDVFIGVEGKEGEKV